MTFANPLGLFGLLALPVLVVIHLYHRRYPVLEVAGLQLWGVETELRSPGRTREILPITASLILELLAALLLTFLLARPQFGAATRLQHLVVVLDNSASMSSQPTGEASFRDQAVAKVQKRLQELGRRSVVTVIVSGPRPTMLAGPAVSWEEAEEKLKTWQPRLARHEFGPSWDLAAQLAERATQLLFLTDRLPDEKATTPARMETISVGRPLANVVISAARWTFNSETAQGNVFLRIENRSSRSAEVTVSGRSGEREVFRKSLTMAANASTPLEAEVPGGLKTMIVTASSPADGLSLDSRVTLIEPQVRTVHVAVTIPKETPAFGFVERVVRSLPDVQVAETEQAELVFAGGGELPESRRSLWWFGVGPLDASDEAKKKAIDLADRTPYLIDKRHPLVNGLSLGGIIWAGVQPTPWEGSPLISAGPHRLLMQLAGTQTTTYMLNIDLGRSNLAESPDWPILLSNLVELRRDNLPGLRQWNYRLNEQIRFRLFEGTADPDSGGELTLWHDGESRPIARGAVVELPPLDDIGVFDIKEGDRTIGQFAVNFFDAAESRLTDLDSGEQPAKQAEEPQGFDLDNPYSWILLLAMGLVLAAALANWRVLKPVSRT